MADQKEAPQVLQYKLLEKDSVLLVALTGSLVKSNAAVVLEKCQDEIAQSKAKYIIVSLQGVTEITVSEIPAFVKLQVSIRKESVPLRLCYISSLVGKVLTEQGAIWADEVFETPTEALVSCRHLFQK